MTEHGLNFFYTGCSSTSHPASSDPPGQSDSPSQRQSAGMQALPAKHMNSLSPQAASATSTSEPVEQEDSSLPSKQSCSPSHTLEVEVLDLNFFLKKQLFFHLSWEDQ